MPCSEGEGCEGDEGEEDEAGAVASAACADDSGGSVEDGLEVGVVGGLLLLLLLLVVVMMMWEADDGGGGEGAMKARGCALEGHEAKGSFLGGWRVGVLGEACAEAAQEDRRFPGASHRRRSWGTMR